MIPLSPPQLDVKCPRCKAPTKPVAVRITGVHNMLSVRCEACAKDWLQEMPVNAGMFYPGTLDPVTGKRVDDLPFRNWYLAGLEQAYATRSRDAVPFRVEELRPRRHKRLAILNTIDDCYGHSLFAIFNAQHYLEKDEADLAVIVQKHLRWLVPDGVAQVWVADVPFRKGGQWHDGLADRIADEITKNGDVAICQSFVQTDSSDCDIERFTRVKPFPLDEWDARMSRPTVTFIWRSDRFWRRFMPRVIDNRFSRQFAKDALHQVDQEVQRRWIIALADELRRYVPNLDFAVAGMDSQRFSFPSWIKDYRQPTHTDESARAMCERYAQSQLVIGCNGSSLILPCAHAGAVINLVPGDLWSVSAGSFPFRITSVGDTHYRYVMLPSESSIKRIASVAVAVMRDRSLIALHTSAPWRDHEAKLDPFAWAEQRRASFNVSRMFENNQGMITTPRPE